MLLSMHQAHALEERLRQQQQQPQQERQQQQQQQQQQHGSTIDSRQMSAGTRHGSAGQSSPWPTANRTNPYEEQEFQPAQVNSYTCQKSFKVSCCCSLNTAQDPEILLLNSARGTNCDHLLLICSSAYASGLSSHQLVNW